MRLFFFLKLKKYSLQALASSAWEAVDFIDKILSSASCVNAFLTEIAFPNQLLAESLTRLTIITCCRLRLRRAPVINVGNARRPTYLPLEVRPLLF